MRENWAGNVRFDPRRVVEPGPANAANVQGRIAELDRRVDLVAAAVREAGHWGRHVRAVGSVWSFTDVVEAEDVLITTDGLSQIIDTTASAGPLRAAVGPAKQFAFVEAGAKLHVLFAALAQQGLSVITAGSSSGQAIAGVMSTSTHGADFRLAPLPDAVRALLLVTPEGERVWLEPSSDRLTSTDAAALTLATQATVRRDDALFDAALVALGTMGIVCALVLEVVPLYGLSEQITRTTWSAVRPTLSEATPTAFGPVPPGAPHPAPGVGPSEYGFLEVILNPYRTSDDYAAASGDRAVVLCTRVRAPKFPGTPWQRNKPSLIDGLSTLWAIVGGAQDEFRKQIDVLIGEGRQDSGGFHPAADVFDFGAKRTSKVWSVEACVRTSNDVHLDFIDALLTRFDALFAQGHRFAGFLSIRFTQRTRASLGMQNGPTGPSGRYCHVEMFALEHPVHLGGWDPTRLAAQSELFMRAYWEEAASRASSGQVFLHWGQQGRSAEDFFARRARFPRLRSHHGAVREIAGKRAFTCVNDFCVRSGAVPLDTGWKLVATALPPARSDAPLDCHVLAAAAPVALGDDVLTVHGDAFVAISRSRGAWQLCLQPLEIVDASDAIAGAIAAARNEDGRPEIFARGRNGLHHHRWRTNPMLGHAASWSPWTPLGGAQRFSSDLAVERAGDGALHVAAIDRTGKVVTRQQRNANGQLGWTAWSELSAPPVGTPTGTPALVRRSDGVVVAFVADDGGRVWSRAHGAPAWTATGITTAGGDPVAAASGSGVIVVAPRSAGGLEAVWIANGAAPSAPSSTFGAVRPRDGTRLAIAPIGGRFLVALTDADGTVVPFRHGGASGWQSHPAPVIASAVSTPALVTVDSTRARVYVKVAHDLLQTRVLTV